MLFQVFGIFNHFEVVAKNKNFEVKGRMEIQIKLDSDPTMTLMSFTSNVVFDLSPSISPSNTLNFVDVSRIHVVDTFMASQYSYNCRVNQLNTFLSDSLTYLNLRQNYKLLESEIPLNIYFQKLIRPTMIEGYGYLVAGDFRNHRFDPTPSPSPSTSVVNNIPIPEKQKFLH